MYLRLKVKEAKDPKVTITEDTVRAPSGRRADMHCSGRLASFRSKQRPTAKNTRCPSRSAKTLSRRIRHGMPRASSSLWYCFLCPRLRGNPSSGASAILDAAPRGFARPADTRQAARAYVGSTGDRPETAQGIHFQVRFVHICALNPQPATDHTHAFEHLPIVCAMMLPPVRVAGITVTLEGTWASPSSLSATPRMLRCVPRARNGAFVHTPLRIARVQEGIRMRTYTHAHSRTLTHSDPGRSRREQA